MKPNAEKLLRSQTAKEMIYYMVRAHGKKVEIYKSLTYFLDDSTVLRYTNTSKRRPKGTDRAWHLTCTFGNPNYKERAYKKRHPLHVWMYKEYK